MSAPPYAKRKEVQKAPQRPEWFGIALVDKCQVWLQILSQEIERRRRHRLWREQKEKEEEEEEEEEAGSADLPCTDIRSPPTQTQYFKFSATFAASCTPWWNVNLFHYVTKMTD